MRSPNPVPVTPLLAAVLVLGAGAGCRAGAPAPEERPMIADPTPWTDAAGDVAHPELAAICAELWEHRMRESPTWATRIGDPRYHGLLRDISPAGFAARDGELGGLLARLEPIDPALLGEEDRVTRAVLRSELALALRERRLPLHLETFVVDPLRGPQVNLLSLGEFQPVATARERELLLERWRAMAVYIDQHAANLRRGLAAGHVASRTAVGTVIEQLDALLAVPPAEDPLAAPARRAADLQDGHAMDEAERARFQARVLALVEDAVRPAFARYRDLLAQEVLPAARPDDRAGIGALAGGDELYALYARRHTTLDLAPDSIHAVGLEQVARVRAEMEELGRRAFGTADLAALQERLRSDPSLFFDDARPEELARVAREHLARAEAAVPRVFGRLPRTPCEVHVIPAHEAPASTTAYYMQPAADGSRPGRYYVNTHEPSTRPRYEAAVLAYHESVPGHHLQIALAMELEGLPLVRRHGSVTAYVEGWALYTERLADELGLYDTDLDRLGMLSYDAWRACRLVVDTGLHAFGWSREQAIEFMLGNTLLSRANIENEVDRYIAWPGQALAYMLGRLEIERLRGRAEERLGERFDLAAFHDELLRHGPLPLEVLAAELERWIGARASGPGPEAGA